MKTLKRLGILGYPLLALVLVAVLLMFERWGIQYDTSQSSGEYLPQSVLSQKKTADQFQKECLVLIDSTQEENESFRRHMEDVLSQMRVGYTLLDVSRTRISDLSAYRTAVITFSDLDVLAEQMLILCDWVKGGGKLMLQAPPDPSVVFRTIADKLGVAEGGTEYISVVGLRMQNNLLLGSNGYEYPWEEPSSSVLNVRMKADSVVYMVSNDSSAVPMLWKTEYGKGRFVVNNHGFCEKATRGLTMASYSLLEDISAYPVVNASTFFLDDFPSPVPGGNATYVKKYYNRDTASFYANVWWPDMLKIGDRYGVKYTGMVIEDYNDDISPPFKRNTDIERFRYFGGMLLEHGGEIGLHGYNHMPLCLDGFDFKGKVDYDTFPSKDAMRQAVNELVDFTESLFPGNDLACYVPPSNILSKEGREVLVKDFPQIKILSGLYLVEDYEYEQEFKVADDGIIELPRIISGAKIDTYMRWAAINELTAHYVNSHFMHPDDVLDEDRGAALGWEKLYGTLNEYIDWLYGVAPHLRNTTASEAAKAVQRYDVLSVTRTVAENSLHLELGGFYDEAYMMVRINQGRPAKVTGGSLEQLGGDLYILRATAAQVDIEIER